MTNNIRNESPRGLCEHRLRMSIQLQVNFKGFPIWFYMEIKNPTYDMCISEIGQADFEIFKEAMPRS